MWKSIFRKSAALFFASVLVALASVAPAHAKAAYYKKYCAKSGCHVDSISGSPDDSPTCAGCHYHGMFTGRHNRTMNFRGWTDKTVYAAGELMTIYMTGGDKPGWARTRILDEKQHELARSTGPTGMGDDQIQGWTESVLPGPIVLQVRAPYLPGTYQWKAGWYGNIYAPNPPAMLDHVYLKWHDVPLPPFDVYSTDAVGPSTSVITTRPSISGGARDVTITALVSDAGSGMTPIRAARCMVGEDGPFRPLEASDGAFDAASEQVRGVFDISTLQPGTVKVFVQAADALGNWGPPTTTTFEVTPPPSGDTTPPWSFCPSYSVGPVPPGTPARLSVAIDDRSTGGSPIHGAEAFMTTPGPDGTGIPMEPADGALDDQIETMIGLIPTAGLEDGSYTVAVHGYDATGSWGPCCLASFDVRLAADPAGPRVEAVLISPNPTHGAGSIDLSATATDVNTGNTLITGAEFRVVAPSSAGTAASMQPGDGLLDSSSEQVTGTMSLAGWPVGAYIVDFRARDLSGRWGPEQRVSLQVTDASADQEGPVIRSLDVNPNPTNGAMRVTLAGKADDSSTGGARTTLLEYFLTAPGPIGSGTLVPLKGNRPGGRFKIAVDISSVMMDMHLPIYVRAMDEHGNWGPLSAVPLQIMERGAQHR